MEKSGIDYARLRAANRGLIYLAISGYGHTGPRAGQAGYDLAAQGESGAMMLTGEPDGAPMRFPTPMVGMTTGMFGLIGVLAALHAHPVGRGAVHRCGAAGKPDDLAGKLRRRN